MSTNYSIGWHVLYVKSRSEKRVHEALQEMSITSFLPLVKTMRRWSDRKKIIEQPLFPSYVFVYINSSLDFYKALSVNGACAYIRFGNQYARVREDEINNIKILIGAKDIENLTTDETAYEVGDKTVISYGSLCGLECEIIDVHNTNRIVVRIDSMQQNLTAIIPAYYLQKAV
ncbi:MAG: UpxY family transcription antiterminator [Bacteroidota bacterium]